MFKQLLSRTNDQLVNRAILITGIAWIILTVGFGIYYYFDHFGMTGSSSIENDVEHLGKVIEENPTDLNTRVSIALYLLERDQVDEAIRQGEAVLEAEPNYQDALFVTGKAYLAKKNDDKVVEYFSRIVDLNKDYEYANLNPTLGTAYFDLGNIYLKRQQFDKAEEMFKGALTVDRSDADSCFGLGQAFMGQGNYDLAIDAFTAALLFDPEYGPFYKGLKEAYEAKGMNDQAAYADAMVLYSQGNYSRATEQLLKVTKSLPDFAEAYRALGMNYEKLGKKNEAADAYKRALELDSGDQFSLQGLGRTSTELTD